MAALALALLSTPAFAQEGPRSPDVIRGAGNPADPTTRILGAMVDRVDDALGDAAERVRGRKTSLGAGGPGAAEPMTTRVVDREGDALERAWIHGARRDAHLARVLDRAGDREERRIARDQSLLRAIGDLSARKFSLRDRGSSLADVSEDERHAAEIVKREDSKGANATTRREAADDKRASINDERQQERDALRRQRLDEAARERKTEVATDRRDRAAEAKRDAADDKKDRDDEKKTDRDAAKRDAKDEAAKDRAEERKDRRDEVRQSSADDRLGTKQP